MQSQKRYRERKDNKLKESQQQLSGNEIVAIPGIWEKTMTLFSLVLQQWRESKPSCLAAFLLTNL
jgi:hypothetical protein